MRSRRDAARWPPAIEQPPRAATMTPDGDKAATAAAVRENPRWLAISSCSLTEQASVGRESWRCVARRARRAGVTLAQGRHLPSSCCRPPRRGGEQLGGRSGLQTGGLPYRPDGSRRTARRRRPRTVRCRSPGSPTSSSSGATTSCRATGWALPVAVRMRLQGQHVPWTRSAAAKSAAAPMTPARWAPPRRTTGVTRRWTRLETDEEQQNTCRPRRDRNLSSSWSPFGAELRERPRTAIPTWDETRGAAARPARCVGRRRERHRRRGPGCATMSPHRGNEACAETRPG